MNYRKCTQSEIDAYWPCEDKDRRIPIEAVISRNVFQALKDAEKDTNLHLEIKNWHELSEKKTSKPKLFIRWAGAFLPSGRDIFKGSLSLTAAVDDMISDHVGGEDDYLNLVADEFEAMARRIRRKSK